MKKTLLIAALIMAGITNAQNVNIPDAIFKSALVNDPFINSNQDSEIQVTEATAYGGGLSVTALGIQDLTGIEAFVNLLTLNVTGNSISTLDLSQNANLMSLDCPDNNLTSLTIPLSLQSLTCQNNNLTTLDLSPSTGLVQATCYGNNLTDINLSNNLGLALLQCYDNDLATLDVSNCSLIQVIECYENNLTTLDVSNNAQLAALVIDDNNIASIDLSNNGSLQAFSCSGNPLTQLDLTNNLDLLTFSCNNTQITTLDVSLNTDINDFEAFDNPNLNTLNVANTNNANFGSFIADNNPALFCIEVDDENYSTTNWQDVDAQVVFSEDCAALASVLENENPGIKIYPNPASDFITVNTNFKIESIEIYDALGALVITSNSNQIDLSGLASGVFMVAVKANENTNFERIIKQ